MEYTIVFLPLAAAVISGFFGKGLGIKISQILSSSLVSVSAILSIVIFYKVILFNLTKLFGFLIDQTTSCWC